MVREPCSSQHINVDFLRPKKNFILGKASPRPGEFLVSPQGDTASLAAKSLYWSMVPPSFILPTIA